MNKKSCLNCGHEISDEFCPHCGQKSDTARITSRTLIKSDILGSVWHVEAKFLRTLKHVLLGPGRMGMDYISGKRVKYYSLFFLLLILFGFNVLAMHFYLDLNPKEIPEESSKLVDVFSKYSKTILFVLIPLLALNAWILFNRIKLNFAEHIIIASVSLSGILILLLLDDLVSIIAIYKPLSKIFNGIDQIIVLSCIVFPAYTYWNAFKKSYLKLGLVWRLLVFYFLMGIECLLIMAVLYKNILS